MRFYNLIIQKGVIGLISILLVVAIISAIIYLAPVDPASVQFGQRVDPQAIELLRKNYFLDKSYSEQVWRYFEDLFPLQIIDTMDSRMADYSFAMIAIRKTKCLIIKWPYLRKSYSNGEPVIELIIQAVPSTLFLAGAAMLISIFLGLLLGAIAAIRHNSWIDHCLVSLATVCYAIPSYISAILFALVFGYIMQEYTGLPIQGSLFNMDDFGNERLDLRYLILPAFALGIRPIAMILQITRAAFLEILSKEYIRTAYAGGLTFQRILLKHVFPNAMNPIITIISGWLASLLTGAYFVEFVFNYRGLGDLTIQAMSQFDIPVILGTSIITVVIFVIINFISDILYTYLDPRIKI